MSQKITLTREKEGNIVEQTFVEIEDMPQAGLLFGELKDMMQLFSSFQYLAKQKNPNKRR